MKRLFGSLVLISMVLCGTLSLAQCYKVEERAKDEMINLEFNNVDVRLVAKFVSDLTGEEIVVSDDVNKGITIRKSAVPVSKLLETVKEALAEHGLAMEQEGEILQIVPAQAKEK